MKKFKFMIPGLVILVVALGLIVPVVAKTINVGSEKETLVVGQPVDLTYAAEKAVNSVVYIKVTVNSRTESVEYYDPFEDFFGDFFGRGNGGSRRREMQTPKRQASGSGVIISEDGYIITNAHVISGASQIKVRTSDKTEYEAELIGSDTKSDIAVLKIEATGLTPAVIGDSDKLVVGEFTLAVGNPMGTLGGTVTNGIISALNRDITVQGQTMNLLQTNAAVSPGNSGGGLFNEKGELIGIVNAKSAEEGAEGLGFAIPVNTAMQVAQSLIDNGYVTGRPALGIQVLAVSDWQMMMQYGVSQPGVYIVDVTEGSCADKAGLQAGDLFVSIDGNAVADTVDVTSALDSHAVGDTIEVQVARQGKVVQVSVVLEEQSAQAAQAAAQPSSEQTQQAG